ncbi:MAG: bpX6 domain-containing protein [Pseudomonadota bacterium]|nr:bpX6 domain-containing protein [Pseudomonadota bacterium]
MIPPLLRGSVLVRAVWLDARWHPPAAIRRLALTLWRPGATVYELDGGLLVRFEAPRRIDCGTAPGLPFVEVGDSLWAWAPSPTDLSAATAAFPGDPRLHRLREGRREAIALGTLRDAAPWTWFDVAGPLAETWALGPPPAAILAPASKDVRARLGHPAMDPAAVALQQELARLATGGAPPQPGWLATLAGGLLALMEARKAAGSGSGGGGEGAGMGIARSAGPPVPSWLERMARKFAAPLLGPLLGRQHGRFLNELVDLFEKGDLDAALRRAIPLGGGLGPSLPPALGLPTPRADLGLRLTHGGSTSSISVDDHVLKLLRDMYQRALDKLVAEGRIEEAAFVLVELLRDHRRAIDLLEKHEKWAVAAEIAEAAQLGPEVAARLWVRAGKLDRAVSLARRTGSFAACLAVIETADADRGLAFRAAYAAHLAAAGDPAGAVGICWNAPTLRPLAMRWLDDALAAGGAAGVRLLPRRLLVDPKRFDEVYAQVRELLEGDAPEDVTLRGALAEGLLAADSPGARTLARPLLRHLVADQARSPAHVEVRVMNLLRDLAADAALTADLPAHAAATTLWGRVEPLRWTVDATDRGATHVRDLVLLPRGRVLVALGEAGARVLDRKGRVVALFDEPCDALAVHDAGTRAIAVARRPGLCRLARLDLVAGTAARWIDVPMGPFAHTYDGSFWFVAEGDALIALDPLADRASALWRVTTGGPIERLTRGEHGVAVHVGGTVRQGWRYAHPNLRLDERAVVPEDDWAVSDLSRHGARLEVQAARGTSAEPVLPMRRQDKGQGTPKSLLLPLPAGLDTFRPQLITGGGPASTLIAGVTADRAVALLYNDMKLLLTVELRGARQIVARLGPEHLALADDLGRVEIYELQAGSRVRGLRV